MTTNTRGLARPFQDQVSSSQLTSKKDNEEEVVAGQPIQPELFVGQATAAAAASVQVPKASLLEKSKVSFGSLSVRIQKKAASIQSKRLGLPILAAAAALSVLVMKQSAISQTTKILATAYMTLLHQNPMMTKSLSAGIIRIMGDFMAQNLEFLLLTKKNNTNHHQVSDPTSTSTGERRIRKKMKYDRRRGVSVCLDGVLISGPLMHLAYGVFENVLPSASSSLAAVSHVFADAVLLDSIFVATTLIVTGLVEGYKWRQELWPQMKRDYLPTLTASWVTSIGLLPLQFVAFRYLPVTLRVLAVNCVDVIWDTVVSFIAHRNRDHDYDLEEEVPAAVVTDEDVPALLLEDCHLEPCKV